MKQSPALKRILSVGGARVLESHGPADAEFGGYTPRGPSAGSIRYARHACSRPRRRRRPPSRGGKSSRLWIFWEQRKEWRVWKLVENPSSGFPRRGGRRSVRP